MELVVTSKDELRELVQEAVRTAMENKAGKNIASDNTEQAEINTMAAKRMLREKGYRVAAVQSFNAFIDQHGIKGVKRGKENWYKRADIVAIPGRI